MSIIILQKSSKIFYKQPYVKLVRCFNHYNIIKRRTVLDSSDFNGRPLRYYCIIPKRFFSYFANVWQQRISMYFWKVLIRIRHAKADRVLIVQYGLIKQERSYQITLWQRLLCAVCNRSGQIASRVAARIQIQGMQIFTQCKLVWSTEPNKIEDNETLLQLTALILAPILADSALCDIYLYSIHIKKFKLADVCT